MAKAAITKRTVDAAIPGSRDRFLWDTSLAGFGLKITPRGRKVYVFQYRITRAGAAERTPARRYTIGTHGRLTPAEARQRARELAALVDQGIDPREREQVAKRESAARRAREQARLESELTLANLAQAWLDHYEHEKQRRPSSVAMARLVVTNHLLPPLGDKPLPHITRTDLQAVIDSIPATQRAMRRSVFAYASVFFGWALARGYIETNPLSGMAKPEAPRARDRVLSDAELHRVWQASLALRYPFGPFFRLLILTGQRRSEVAALDWSELDQSESIWTIPAERAKNGVAHIVPLSPLACAELHQLATRQQQRSGTATGWPRSGFVLTTTGKTAISGISKAKKALDNQVAKAAGPLTPWRIHDLRRTLATGLQRLGVRFEVTEAVLNHISGARSGIAGIYQRYDWQEEKRAAANAWAAHVECLIGDDAPGNILRLANMR